MHHEDTQEYSTKNIFLVRKGMDEGEQLPWSNCSKGIDFCRILSGWLKVTTNDES